MAVNDETLALIKRWEGLRLDAYQDQAGIWTIGYGHTLTARPGMTITEARATELLRGDLRDAEAAVDDAVKVPMTDNQRGALVSFVFNVGGGAFRGSTLLRKLNAGNYDAVPGELAKWNKITVNGRKVANSGLANRRAVEAGLWARGAPVASNTVEPAAPKETASAPVQGGVGVAAGGVLATLLANAGGALTPLASLPWQVGIAVVAAAAIGWWLYSRRRESA